MLSGYSVTPRAFTQRPDEEGNWCRACVLAALAKTHKQPEAAVQRLEAGLTREAGGWRVVGRYEVDGIAVENGYEYHDVGEMDHDDPELDADGEQMVSCPECGVERCFGCGTRLDTTPEEEQAAKERVEAAGRTWW